ncbi:MAG: proton-conducting transporter membrane subunit [Acidobacteriota bacterium]
MSGLTPETAIAVGLLGPLVVGVLLVATGRWPNLRDGLNLVGGTGVFLAVLRGLYPAVAAGERPTLELVEVLPGLALAFRVEPLGLLFALVASGLWIVTSLYAVGYLRGHHEGHQTRFFLCFAAAIFGALGVAFAANVFTLFVFYELITLSTYPLVTHHGTADAQRAGRVYLGVLMSTSIGFLLLAMAWTYSVAGTLDFRAGGILGEAPRGLLAPLLALYAFGAAKAALMPFHRWLPAAMVAPTPVSALLHAVAVVKAGVFTVTKVVVYVFGLDLLRDTGAADWLLAVAAFTLLAASVIALYQDNLKRRLAYSTISQLAYIVLGAALLAPRAVLGAALHIVMHAFGKITLFFCAGAIDVAAHRKKISQMHGIGRRMPITMLAFFVGSLSVAGIPPTGGAWSKWLLAEGAADGSRLVAVLIYMSSSLLALGYLMPVVAKAFFLPPAAEDEFAQAPGRAEPLLCVLPPALTAIGCIALYFGADSILRLLEGML